MSVVRGPLQTKGNLVLDGLGHPLTLRGVVSDWLDWQSSIANGALLLLLLPLTFLAVQFMRWWSKVLSLSQKPQFQRAR